MSIESEKNPVLGAGIVQRFIEHAGGNREPSELYYLSPGDGVFFGRDGTIKVQSSDTPIRDKDVVNLLYCFYLDKKKGQLHIIEGVGGHPKQINNETGELYEAGELRKGKQRFVYAWNSTPEQARRIFFMRHGHLVAPLN